MSTPGLNAGASNPPTSGSAGPSTPAAAGLPPSTTAAIAQHNVSTPRSNPSTVHPSPANHRSPATIRSLGATPMARAGSLNVSGNTLGAVPMQRGHTTGMKGLGTPSRGGKTVPGVSSAGLGLGIGGSATPVSGLAFSSPAANQASPGIGMTPGTGGSNAALGAFDSPANAIAAGAVDMGISLSNLGISMGTGLSTTGSTAGRIDEDERRRRLEAVLDTLRKRPGRISREAVERLGRRCEMDTMDGGDELSLAGKNVMVDVHFNRNKSAVIERVSVTFPTASDAMAAHVEKASRILQHDLTVPRGIATINASLDKFSDNLERLARLDKLSIPGANCFEAVFGIYTSLKRLYDHEKRIAESILSSGSNSRDNDVAMEVICKKSGRPRMHSRNRVGLSLEYWRQRRFVARCREKGPKDVDAMDIDVDKESAKPNEPEVDDEEGDVASITIECEPSPPALYPTIRITDSWLSERIGKPPEETDAAANANANANANESTVKPEETIVEWADPPPPLIPTVEPDPMSANAAVSPSQPHARFIAKLEPPIVLPLQIAAQVYASVDVNIMQESIAPSTFDGLVFTHTQPSVTSGEPRQISSKRVIVTVDKREQTSHHEWDLCLFLSRAEPAVRIEQLPFSHPRQVIAILPILRQYAFVTKLLQNTFTALPESYDHKKHGMRAEMAPRDELLSNGYPTQSDLFAFLSEPPSVPRTLDVAFSTVPSPHLTVNMASPGGVKQVTFSILQNAEIELNAQDVIMPPGQELQDAAAAESNGPKTERAKQGLIRGLVVSEDLGVWAEWVRQRFIEGG